MLRRNDFGASEVRYGGVQVSDKTKNGPLFKARVFLPVIHNIRFDLAEPTGIGLDAEPRWKSALRRLHAGRAPCRQRCTPRLRPGFPRGAFTGLLA